MRRQTPAQKRAATPLLHSAGNVLLDRALWRGWRILLAPLAIVTAAIAGAHHAHSKSVRAAEQKPLFPHPAPEKWIAPQIATSWAEGRSTRREEAAVVRLSAEEVERLDILVARMIAEVPALSEDDCVDAVFSEGLASSLEAIQTTALLRGLGQ